MEWIETVGLTDAQKEAIISIWNEEYPVSLNYQSMGQFDEYLSPLKDQHHVLVFEGENLCAWAFRFYREEEQWFAIIVSSLWKGKGLGGRMVQKLCDTVDQISGWVMDLPDIPKADGSFYQSPLDFYLRLGFKLLPEQRFENEKMSAVKIQWRRSAE